MDRTQSRSGKSGNDGMPVPDLARLLAAAGAAHVDEAAVRRDLAAGAPANPDGTVNLIRYAAWLAARDGIPDSDGPRPRQDP